jgi:hypothetical protein
MQSYFLDRSAKPDAGAVAKALGKTARLWKKLREDLESEHGTLTDDWKCYSGKSGWTMKLLRKKRNLFFMMPQKDHFLITVILGDRAVTEVEKSDVPEAVKRELRSARKYAEGRGVTVAVESRKDTDTVRRLVGIKLAN